MSNSFLTLEDVNSVLFRFGMVEYFVVDTSLIAGDDGSDYTDVLYDFVKVSRTYNTTVSEVYDFTFEVDNSAWTGGYYVTSNMGYYQQPNVNYEDGKLTINNMKTGCKLVLLMVPNRPFQLDRLWHTPREFVHYVDYSHYNPTGEKHITNLEIPVYRLDNGTQSDTITQVTNWGLNEVPIVNGDDTTYIYVFLLRTNFKFNCTQPLTIGKTNRVLLGADTDYKPQGALIGEHTPNITVNYNGDIIPVEWSPTDNDYVFNLDLTHHTQPSKIHFTVNIETNPTLNATSTEVTLNADYYTITTQQQLKNACNRGGERILRLGANITITQGNILVNHPVKIIGNNHTLNLNQYQFQLQENTQLILENLTLTNGKNTIHQKTGSKLDITDCTFNNCTGIGSIIQCDIDVTSLDNPTDFTTNINRCTIRNSDMAILHGGNLVVRDTTVTGKISHKEYPYFLYQTDGTAILTRNRFQISSNTVYDYDLEFNTCIFICGETAQINNLTHTELQNNNINTFLTNPINNTSTIDLTYYYQLIEDTIHLKSTNGYCHTVSGSDYVHKTNITLERGDQ